MADERIVQAIKIVDPTTTSQQAAVDATGFLQVDIAASSVTVTVDGTGTLAVQVDGDALTALQLIDNPVQILGTDTYLEATDSAFLIGVVRSDTLAAKGNTDNEIVPLQVDALGALYCVLAANTGVDIGDVDVLSVVPGVAATNLGKAESATHTSGDVGVLSLAVRDDTPVGLAADGEYIPLTVDSVGRLHVTDPNAGAGAPSTPVVDVATSAAVAAGSTADLDSSADVANGNVLWGVDISSSVAFKAKILWVDDGVDSSDYAIIFGRAGEPLQWRPPNRNFFTKGTGGAGVDIFQVEFTNMDTSEPADAYATFYHAAS